MTRLADFASPGDRCAVCNRAVTPDLPDWIACGCTVAEYRAVNGGGALHPCAADSRPSTGEGWLLLCSEACDRVAFPWEYRRDDGHNCSVACADECAQRHAESVQEGLW